MIIFLWIVQQVWLKVESPNWYFSHPISQKWLRFMEWNTNGKNIWGILPSWWWLGPGHDDDFFDAQVLSLIWGLFTITNSNTENGPNLNQIHNALMIIILLILTIVKMMTWSKYSDFGVLRIKSKYMSISLTYLSNHLINDHPFLLYQSYSIQHTERCPDFHLFSDAFNILLSKCVKF